MTFALIFQAHAGQFVHVCECVYVAVCVTDWDTNETSDYSGKPQVIISSPRIKNYVAPAATSTVRYLFFHWRSRKTVHIKERWKLAPETAEKLDQKAAEGCTTCLVHKHKPWLVYVNSCTKGISSSFNGLPDTMGTNTTQGQEVLADGFDCLTRACNEIAACLASPWESLHLHTWLLLT